MVLCNEGTRTARNVIIPTKGKLKTRPRRWRDKSELLGEEVDSWSEEDANDDALLVEPSPETQKRCFAPIMRITENKKNTLTCAGCHIAKQTLEVIISKAMS